MIDKILFTILLMVLGDMSCGGSEYDWPEASTKKGLSTVVVDWPATPSKASEPRRQVAEAWKLETEDGTVYQHLVRPARESGKLDGICSIYAFMFAAIADEEKKTRTVEVDDVTHCYFEVMKPGFGVYGNVAQNEQGFHVVYATFKGSRLGPDVVAKAKGFADSLRFK